MIRFIDTGLSANSVPYEEALQQQRELHAAVACGSAPDTVVLLEHESVYTAGKRTEDHERPRNGSRVIDVDRGGKITWHGPGQLVGYPIMRLSEPLDVVAYVRQLEEMMIAVCAAFGIEGFRVPGRSGVWVAQRDSHGTSLPEAKIGAVGIRVAENVTMHGFALNCSNSLEAYEHIVACGISDAGVTTLSREAGHQITPREVAPRLTTIFREVFEPVRAVKAPDRATASANGEASPMATEAVGVSPSETVSVQPTPVAAAA